MKQDKKLILGMALLFFITFVSLGTLVATEKLAPYYTDKIEEKIKDYLNKNYKEEVNNFSLGKVTYKAQVYQVKVKNKQNKNLYFKVYYQNKKIKDTYKKDYLEGKTLLTKLENSLEKKIKKNLNIKATITFPLTLNKYTNSIKENILNNDLDKVNIYNIDLTINSSLKEENINSLIIDIQNMKKEINNLKINPNYYKITINSKKEKKQLTIKNLTNKTLEQEPLTQIMNYIMIENENIDNKNNIIKENNISYEYKERSF